MQTLKLTSPTLVFGASGRLGREITRKLLAAGRDVVAVTRDEANAEKAFEAMGIVAGKKGAVGEGSGAVLVRALDVTDPAQLTKEVGKLGDFFAPIHCIWSDDLIVIPTRTRDRGPHRRSLTLPAPLSPSSALCRRFSGHHRDGRRLWAPGRRLDGLL